MPFQCQRSWRASIFWSILTSILRRLKRAPRRPKTAHGGDPSAKTVPRGPQDGPKMAPRGPKSWDRFRVFSILAAKSPQPPPETPPRLIFGSFLVDFLVDFRWFLRWFLVDFSCRTPSCLDLGYGYIYVCILYILRKKSIYKYIYIICINTNVINKFYVNYIYYVSFTRGWDPWKPMPRCLSM